ncbi:MAG TPA: DUF5693 family protein [Symbiobacteriaceae bacterium]|nr:DUF5693 family protein [Symbiobacteriaceae bacterium]
MPHGRNTRRLAWVLVLVGLLAALPVLWNRAERERANTGVDLVLEMTSFQTLALQDGEPIADLLRKMQVNGATGLAVAEMSVKDLADRGYAVVQTGAELQALGALNGNAFVARLLTSGQLERNATYVLPFDQGVTKRLQHDLPLRFGSERMAYLAPQSGEAGTGAFVLRYPEEKLKDFGVGFDPADFALADAAGLRPVPRPRPAPGTTPEGVKQIWTDLAKLAPKADSVIFYGEEIIGYRTDSNDGLLATAAAINKLGWTVDLIEHMSQLSYVEQKGYQLVAEATNYRVARVFSMGQAWQNKELPSNVVNMWARAVPERNIRVLFIRPFFGNLLPGQTATTATAQTLLATSHELAKQGFGTGTPGFFTPYEVPWLMRGLMGIAVVGAALLWLGLFVELRERFWVPLGLAGALLSVAACFVAPNAGATLVSMGAAALFPTLAVTWIMDRWSLNAQADAANLPTAPQGARSIGSLVAKVAAGLLTFFGLCLVGGLLVAASLGDIQHMLEFAFFRGVKLVFILPLLLVLVGYVLLGRTGSLAQTGRFLLEKGEGILDRSVKYRDLAVGAVVGLAVVYYITRSGNFPILPVSGLELKMRTALEELLFARPRNKEFLIAYPALILAATLLWSGWRRWVWLLLVAASTGAVSVVNSFEHVRTPWLMSLLRGVNGLWVGALIGTVATLFLYVALQVVLRFRTPDQSS